MSLELRIIQLSDVEKLLSFEEKKLNELVSDETQKRFQAWNSRWRKESLEHYASLGWSFLAEVEGELVGYFLAQPLLFFDNQTQSLWVEYIQFSSLQVRDELCNLAYRLAREKHFQRTYFPQISSVANAVKTLAAEDWKPEVLFTKTTR